MNSHDTYCLYPSASEAAHSIHCCSMSGDKHNDGDAMTSVHTHTHTHTHTHKEKDRRKGPHPRQREKDTLSFPTGVPAEEQEGVEPGGSWDPERYPGKHHKPFILIHAGPACHSKTVPSPCRECTYLDFDQQVRVWQLVYCNAGATWPRFRVKILIVRLSCQHGWK